MMLSLVLQLRYIGKHWSPICGACFPQFLFPEKEKTSAKKLEEKHLDDQEVGHFIFTHHLLIISFLAFKVSLLHEVDSTVWVNIKK